MTQKLSVFFIIGCILFSFVYVNMSRVEVAAAGGQLMLLWDGSDSVPAGWTCVSCEGSDSSFYQKFIRGAGTYSDGIQGLPSHDHTGTWIINNDTGGQVYSKSGSNSLADYAHTHTLNLLAGGMENLPLFRQLKVIRYDSAGVPSQLPAGIIAFFDSAVPSGWVRYDAQDGYYIRGENTVGTIGGSNTHHHAGSGTLSSAVNSTRAAKGGSGSSGASNIHTHTFSMVTDTVNNEPPYIGVILGKLQATSSPAESMIGMWNDTPAAGWTTLSDSGSPFYQKFIKPSASYDPTGGGSDTHTHGNLSGIQTSQASGGGVPTGSGSGASALSHTHLVSVLNFSDASNLPIYIDVIFAKKIAPKYTQASYRWFANTDSTQVGNPLAAVDTKAIAPAQGTPFRLRLLMHVTSTTLAIGGQDFKLQIAERSGICDTAFFGESYADVGIGSGSIRFYDNTNVNAFDGALLTATSSDPNDGFAVVNQTYEETNPFTSTSSIAADSDGKWDFSLVDFSAIASTTYCFRVVRADNQLLDSYSYIPEIITAEIQTLSCSVSATSTSFGTLSVAGISNAANVTSTMTCGGVNGCTLFVNDAGNSTNPGLWSSTASHLIQSGTATLVAGTEGYGIQATTTAAGGGGTLSLSATYNKTGANVGGLLLSSAVLASSSAPISSREVVVTHKAAIGNITSGGSYIDTITYSCTGN